MKYTIEWTLSGGLVLGNARVTAIHPLTKAELLVISPDWPKTKPISYTVPGNAPLGNLRIRVQIKGTNTFGDSGVFEVKELKIKPIKPPKTLKQPNPTITVTTPSSLSRYQLDQKINISWEINYLGRQFELELYDLDGINQLAPYPHIFSGYASLLIATERNFAFDGRYPNI
ncbi:hypothetical protein AMJ44_09855 [candidate division WOR-1 bacterium DG_54_3]|uniref:Uncharacterized protein n=1 Tax=candidate division WOR-1 bacterium DG_54_3 TaxID=1703775 RepID=A0A0S7XT42_UNCSA|nr:MAG: hypothetical protein AMJ44_09855 [candidate division WOR-1 bacterium DG_54_3]